MRRRTDPELDASHAASRYGLRAVDDAFELGAWIEGMIGDGALGEARTEIEGAAERPDRDEVGIAWLWGDLAQALAHRGRYDDAIDAMSRALQAGWDGKPDGRCDIADFLTRAGRREEASALWAQVKRDTPQDVWLYERRGPVTRRSGLARRGGRVAGRRSPPGARGRRSRGARGADVRPAPREPARAGSRSDELERRAGAFLAEQRERRRPRLRTESLDEERLAAPGRAATVSLTWFPAGEYERALQRWPDLREEWEGVPQERELDSEDPASRAGYATELTARGRTIPWPPPRNAPCWCGSDNKYKRSAAP